MKKILTILFFFLAMSFNYKLCAQDSLKLKNNFDSLSPIKIESDGFYAGIDAFGKSCSYPFSLSLSYRFKSVRIFSNHLYLFGKYNYLRESLGFEYFPFKTNNFYFGISAIFSINYHTKKMNDTDYNMFIIERQLSDNDIRLLPDIRDTKFQAFYSTNIGYLFQINSKIYFDLNLNLIFSKSIELNSKLLSPFAGIGFHFKIFG